MTTINERIQTGRPTLTEMHDAITNGKYFVDDTFQRRLVWVEKQRVRLIETILIGYPMPEFYLWQQKVDATTGKQRHSVVDGQQRMNAIIQFVGNEWSLKSTYLDNKKAGYANKAWSELEDIDKSRLWNYVINVRTIPSDIDRNEITALFKRLNETDKSLNPQEIRNAEFNGLFLKASEEVADDPLMKKWEKEWNVFTDNEKRRMADITFASSLLIYHRMGISNDTPKNINQIYDLFNDLYEMKDTDLKSIQDNFKVMESIFLENEIIGDFFTSPVHLYTLYVTLDQLRNEDISTPQVAKKLVNFVSVYKTTNNPKPDTLISKYREGAASRTRSKLSREQRVESLFDWVVRD
ncbi:hypothetical protein PsAD5_02536 [Pseudovibrio sp. Ad5]|uniref:DUF262 domain-containing protein n=1 Tax=Pseudovibrio sp. Ad5 TaxID=989436 RepID=UPI0007AE67B1|nr:DUF262 domain-containing protein [Pseudovibrio sp. Ad5]KZK96349.1 hypothetical protein PsAD5_02536 [Pseudovibrio sp. Ad5]